MPWHDVTLSCRDMTWLFHTHDIMHSRHVCETWVWVVWRGSCCRRGNGETWRECLGVSLWYVWDTCEIRVRYVWDTCEIRVRYVWVFDMCRHSLDYNGGTRYERHHVWERYRYVWCMCQSLICVDTLYSHYVSTFCILMSHMSNEYMILHCFLRKRCRRGDRLTGHESLMVCSDAFVGCVSCESRNTVCVCVCVRVRV